MTSTADLDTFLISVARNGVGHYRSLFPSLRTDGTRVILMFTDQSKRGRATYSDNNQQSRELSFAIDNFPTTRATAELALGLGFSRRSYKPSLVYAAILARSALI